MSRTILILLALLGLFACGKPSPGGKSFAPLELNSNSNSNSAIQKVAKNFAVVNDDKTPLHNSAVIDAGGITWSTATVGPVSFVDAEYACNAIGGSLPTSEQLDSLAKFLGRDSEIGFHPEYAKIPQQGADKTWTWQLKSMRLWSATTVASEGDIGMNGDDGKIQVLPMLDADSGRPIARNAICMIPQQRPPFACSWIEPFRTTGKLFSAPYRSTEFSMDKAVRAWFYFSRPSENGLSKVSLYLKDFASGKLERKKGDLSTQDPAHSSLDISVTSQKTGLTYRFICSYGS